MTFEEWQATGRDVDAATIGQYGDFEGATGREHEGGYIVKSGDQWAVPVERDCDLFDKLADAEAFLWATWTAWEVFDQRPAHHIVTAPDGRRWAVLIDEAHDTASGDDALDVFIESRPELADACKLLWLPERSDRGIVEAFPDAAPGWTVTTHHMGRDQ